MDSPLASPPRDISQRRQNRHSSPKAGIGVGETGRPSNGCPLVQLIALIACLSGSRTNLLPSGLQQRGDRRTSSWPQNYLSAPLSSSTIRVISATLCPAAKHSRTGPPRKVKLWFFQAIHRTVDRIPLAHRMESVENRRQYIPTAGTDHEAQVRKREVAAYLVSMAS